MAEALKGRWLTIADLATKLGLTRKQVHGAVTSSENGREFERRVVAGTTDGTREYRLKE